MFFHGHEEAIDRRVQDVSTSQNRETPSRVTEIKALKH